MICPAVNENSTVTEQTLGWMCEVINWRNALSDLKLLVEKECSVSDEDEDWRSVFECPDFSDINCVNESSLQNETDSFNCSISYCGDGNYVDQTFLQPIWIHHHNANRNFMIILQRNFTDCIEIAGSNLNVTCPQLDNNATEAEMSEVWMCEYINWRNALAEWRERVEEECSVSEDDGDWQSAFECPDFSATQCFGGAPKLNETDLLNCSISFCEDGNYSDEQPLRTVSKQQFDIREFLITTYTTKDLRCAIRTTIATTRDTTTTSTTTTATTTVTTDATTDEVMATASYATDWSKSGNLYYKCSQYSEADYYTARKICADYGGRLAAEVLRDPVAVSDIMFGGCGYYNWVGFDDIATDGLFEWSDGGIMNNETLEWNSGAPHNGTERDCVHAYGGYSKLQLTNYDCYYPFGYICEIDAATLDAMTYSDIATGVRLVDGSPSSGRVELFYEGEWGTVCTDSWDLNDAKVICRMLGFGDAITASEWYGYSNGRIWLDDLKCNGEEDSISQCNKSPWGENDCNHYQDASVVCDDRVVRLVNGGFSYGRVELFYDGEWGTVCHDSWDLNDARVICRMLGFDVATSAVGNATYEPGTGKIWLDDLSCNGEETTISQCNSSSWGEHNCSHHEDASVVCDTSVRLVGGESSHGRVEIFYKGEWGTVCGYSWDLNDAKVICRMLGFPGAVSALTHAAYGAGTGRVWLDDLRCNGDEDSISHCHSSSWGVHYCGHHEDVSVVCDTGAVRLTGGASSYGRVELFYDGEWGTICDDSWDLNDAKVICRMLGFGNALSATGNATHAPETGRVWLGSVSCNGEEITISQCNGTSWGKHNCSHHKYASVVCDTGVVRLVDGASSYGRVEVFHEGEWGTVCEYEWDLNDANVICRMLGFPGAISAIRDATYGRGTGRIWLDNVNCNGTENAISQCSSLSWGEFYFYDCSGASVVCGNAVEVAATLAMTTATATEPVATTLFASDYTSTTAGDSVTDSVEADTTTLFASDSKSTTAGDSVTDSVEADTTTLFASDSKSTTAEARLEVTATSTETTTVQDVTTVKATTPEADISTYADHTTNPETAAETSPNDETTLPPYDETTAPDDTTA